MAYTKTIWIDNVVAVTAVRLNNMENGIETANAIIPAVDGEVGQVLTKTEDGVEWAEAGNPPTVTGEVLNL